jgi:O-antigen/teichoic acid export membrane protein
MREERPEAGWLLSIFRTGRWYLFSSVSTKVLALLTLTILTHKLSPAEFGALNALVALTQALPIVVSLYLDAALARMYHDDRGSRHQLATLFSSVFWFVLAWGSVSLVAFSLLYARLTVDLTSVPLAYIWIATIPVLLLQLAQLGMMFLRQSFEARTVAKIEVLGALIGVVATYGMVMVLSEGVLGRLVAIAMSAVYGFAYVAWHFAKAQLLVFRFDKRKLKACLVYSIPLLPNLAAGWIAGASDRLIIAKYVDLEAVGLYSLAVTIASLLYVVQDAVTQVTGVKTQIGMQRDRKRTLHMIGELSIVMWGAMLFVNYCAVAYSVQVVQIFTGEGYLSAAGLIGACGFIYVLSPQNRILQDIIGFNKKTWIISSGALIMAACSLALNFYLIPRYGYVAAPYVFIVSTLAQTAWLYAWVNHFEKLKLRWGKVVLALTVFLLFVYVDREQLTVANSGFLLKLIATGIYAAITWFFLRSSLSVLKSEAHDSTQSDVNHEFH